MLTPRPSGSLSLMLFVGLVFLTDRQLPTAFAQGSLEDYRRSANVSRSVRQTVFRDRVSPNWIDANHLWYRVQTGKREHEFVLVDATRGERTSLFDHERMAELLSEQLKRKVDPRSLPLSGVEVVADRKSIRFSAGGQRFHRELPSLSPLSIGKPVGNSDAWALEPLDRIPRSSRGRGPETEITFVNRSDRDVRLYWRDTRGNRIPYGTVAAGRSRSQHTFANHVWEVANSRGRPLVGFIATANPSEAVITNDLPPIRSTLPIRPNSHRSPDGNWEVQIVRDNVVLKRSNPTGDGAGTFPLTDDGTPDDPYSGRVHWSPDSRWFVVMQTRRPQSHPVHIIESSPADRLQPKLLTLEYLKPGDRIAHPRPRLFDVANKRTVPIADDLFPNPWRISSLRWDADSKRFTFLYNQRGHQVLRLVAVDTSGTVSAVINERSETFIDYNSKLFLRKLEATGELLWMSERDGWNHLWLYDAGTGEVKNQMTRGTYVVRRVEHVDESKRELWFLAGGVRTEQDPYHLHLCRVNFDGSGFTILTEGDGTHEIAFSPDRTWFLDRWSRVDLPPITELRRASDGKLMCVLERANNDALLATGWTTPERFVAVGRDGETNIHGIIIRPSNFDPAKTYPIVERIYAGPHGSHVPKAFGTLASQHAMAELGFILVQIDGMGTNWRSKRFHDVCWQNLADAGFPDRIAWMKAAAKTRPWMDLNRVGIFGGSAGGQNAMRALIDHHDFYQVAVADCGCHDNRMDKIWWNELWMGYPVGPHYAASSNSEHAHRMEGKLMLIVGELDRNVDPASTMQVAASLQKADKDFELVIVVGAGHGAAETRYGSRRRADFLVRHLHGRNPRWTP